MSNPTSLREVLSMFRNFTVQLTVNLHCFAFRACPVAQWGFLKNPILSKEQRECIIFPFGSCPLLVRVVACVIFTCNYYLTLVAHRNAMVPAAELRFGVLESVGFCRGGRAPHGFSKAQRVECRTSLSILGTTCILRGSSFTCESFHSSRHPLEQCAGRITCRHKHVASGGTAPSRETPSSLNCPKPRVPLQHWWPGFRLGEAELCKGDVCSRRRSNGHHDGVF